jgi:hypothetical protein
LGGPTSSGRFSTRPSSPSPVMVRGCVLDPKKIVKSCQLSGQPIFQTISAFPKQGIESHDENACFELFHFFGSQGRRREGLEGFGKVLGRFGRVCKIWEGLGGFGRFGGLGGGVGTVQKDMGGVGKVWQRLGGLGEFGKVWKGLEGFRNAQIIELSPKTTIWESLRWFGKI